MQKFLIKISYDGSCYHGWQIQPNGISVQEVIEKCLKQIAKQAIPIVGSGRTDTGVHATCQYAHFNFPINMSPKQLRLALRTKLPDSIRVTEAFIVPESFHARYDAYKRGYKYILTRKKNPFNRLYKSFIPYKELDIDRMRACVPYLLGQHDFTSFCKPNPQIKSNVCDLYKVDIVENGFDIEFYISANRFLHNMVRRIVGTLVSFSHEKFDPAMIKDLMDAKKANQNIIFTAPPNGLYLREVLYPNFQESLIDQDSER